jgi:hypothetical protein
MHSGSAVPAPSLSRSASVEFADARSRVQVANADTGPDWAQQAGRDEVVDDNLLDPRTGFGATAEGPARDRREEAREPSDNKEAFKAITEAHTYTGSPFMSASPLVLANP